MYDPVQEFIDELDTKLALIELASLTPEVRAEVDEYARHKHWDNYHDPDNFHGFYACCINPKDPRKNKKEG